MTKKPTDDQFNLAIEWLRVNEGEGAEREACNVVADWLDEKQAGAELRAAAREAGLPVAAVRRKLKEMGKL